MEDLVLLYIVIVLLTLGGIMRILLAKKKQEPFPLYRKIQRFVFPALLLAAMLLWQLGGQDHIIAAVLVGLGQELVFYLLFRRKTNI
ncbi:MAG: hypothetical protein PUC06_09035 [Oscillospiraceae bacterium]|nr:hypothetical protein [Oscillospiraceae bacterium]